MKPIWYFVGLILLIIGAILLLAGIYEISSGDAGTAVLGHLYPNLWWGGVMVIVGIIYVVKNKNKVVE